MKPTVFSPWAIAALVAACLGLLGLSLMLGGLDTSPVASRGRAGAGSSYSASAIGQAGFYDLLRRRGHTVTRGTEAPQDLAGSGGLVVFAEPNPNLIDDEDREAVLSIRRVLLVLPKWSGKADPGRPAWISEVRARNPQHAKNVLSLVLPDPREVDTIIRAPWPAGWTTNAFPYAPNGSGQIQLLRSARVQPLIACQDGILVGEFEFRNRKVVIVADPDILNNHGLLQGDNAPLAVAVTERLLGWRNGRGPIVFDEAGHGYRKAKTTLLNMLFQFPMVLVTALIAATAMLLALAGSGRFGAPRREKPVLDFGKTHLIANSARLFDYAGHHAPILRRYVGMTLRDAGSALHAPAGIDEQALADWLDQAGKNRTAGSAASMLQEADTLAKAGNPDGLMALARNIHRWKGEITHGS